VPDPDDHIRVGDRVAVVGRHTARCTSTSTTGAQWWLCDRVDDHRGDHASVSLSGLVLATWTDGDFDSLELGSDP